MSSAVHCPNFWRVISPSTLLFIMPPEDLTWTSQLFWIVFRGKSMATTDKSKKSTSSTPSTSMNLDATFMSGSSYLELIRKVVRIGIADLASTNRKLRDDALRYILSRQFQVDCKTLDLNYQEIIKVIASLEQMSQPQRRATIKHILRVNKV